MGFFTASGTLMVRSMIWLPTLKRSSVLTPLLLRSAVLRWTWLRCTFQVNIVSFLNLHLTPTLIILEVAYWNIVDCASCWTFAALPREILMYIFRWVVSSDLDLRALEQLSLVCRGFYICARSAPPPWQSRCVRVHHLFVHTCWSYFLIFPGTQRFGIRPVQECGEEIALKWSPSSPGGTCSYDGLASILMVIGYFN